MGLVETSNISVHYTLFPYVRINATHIEEDFMKKELRITEPTEGVKIKKLRKIIFLIDGKRIIFSRGNKR